MAVTRLSQYHLGNWPGFSRGFSRSEPETNRGASFSRRNGRPECSVGQGEYPEAKFLGCGEGPAAAGLHPVTWAAIGRRDVARHVPQLRRNGPYDC
jgi:hypothetical protein